MRQVLERTHLEAPMFAYKTGKPGPPIPSAAELVGSAEGDL